MAIKLAKKKAEGYKYVPTTEREEATPFTIWVKPLATHELMVLEDNVVRREADTVMLAAGAFSFKVLQKAVVSWENIMDADDQPLQLKKNADGTVTAESIGCMPPDMITEIANVVSAISRNPGNIQIFFPEDADEDKPKVKKAQKAIAE